MRDREDEVAAKGIEILGVSFDTVEENCAFAEKFDFPYKLLCDVERELGLAYGAADAKDSGFAKRISYVIGEDGKILLAYAKVKPDKHLDQILADVP